MCSFDSIVLGLEAWLDTVEERYEDAAGKVRTALERASDRMTRVVAPHLPSVHLCIAAIVLAEADGGTRVLDAARCLGAADRLLPPRSLPGPVGE